MKKLFALLLALVLTLSCSAASAEEAVDTSLDDLLARGKFILGLDDSFPPMGFRSDDNEIVGYDIDLAKEVCARLGVELVVQPIEWAAKELELNSGNIDCIWNGMSATDERKESMALSVEYMNNAMVLLVNSEEITGRDDLAGKVLAVQSGTPAEEMMDSDEFAELRASLSEVLAYDDYLTAIMDMQNGNVQAVLIDKVVADYMSIGLGDETLHTVDNLADDLFAVGFRKADVALRDKVNEILEAMAADGTTAKICTEWFGSDISIVKPVE